jgi:hypothetical protein
MALTGGKSPQVAGGKRGRLAERAGKLGEFGHYLVVRLISLP